MGIPDDLFWGVLQMPRIDFICQDCHASFAEFVKYEDREKLRCPVCASSAIKQDFLGKWNGSTGRSQGSSASDSAPTRSGFS